MKGGVQSQPSRRGGRAHRYVRAMLASFAVITSLCTACAFLFLFTQPHPQSSQTDAPAERSANHHQSYEQKQQQPRVVDSRNEQLSSPAQISHESGPSAASSSLVDTVATPDNNNSSTNIAPQQQLEQQQQSLFASTEPSLMTTVPSPPAIISTFADLSPPFAPSDGSNTTNWESSSTERATNVNTLSSAFERSSLTSSTNPRLQQRPAASVTLKALSGAEATHQSTSGEFSAEGAIDCYEKGRHEGVNYAYLPSGSKALSFSTLAPSSSSPSLGVCQPLPTMGFGFEEEERGLFVDGMNLESAAVLAPTSIHPHPQQPSAEDTFAYVAPLDVTLVSLADSLRLAAMRGSGLDAEAIEVNGGVAPAAGAATSSVASSPLSSPLLGTSNNGGALSFRARPSVFSKWLLNEWRLWEGELAADDAASLLSSLSSPSESSARLRVARQGVIGSGSNSNNGSNAENNNNSISTNSSPSSSASSFSASVHEAGSDTSSTSSSLSYTHSWPLAYLTVGKHRIRPTPSGGPISGECCAELRSASDFVPVAPHYSARALDASVTSSASISSSSPSSSVAPLPLLSPAARRTWAFDPSLDVNSLYRIENFCVDEADGYVYGFVDGGEGEEDGAGEGAAEKEDPQRGDDVTPTFANGEVPPPPLFGGVSHQSRLDVGRTYEAEYARRFQRLHATDNAHIDDLPPPSSPASPTSLHRHRPLPFVETPIGISEHPRAAGFGPSEKFLHPSNQRAVRLVRPLRPRRFGRVLEAAETEGAMRRGAEESNAAGSEDDEDPQRWREVVTASLRQHFSDLDASSRTCDHSTTDNNGKHGGDCFADGSFGTELSIFFPQRNIAAKRRSADADPPALIYPIHTIDPANPGHTFHRVATASALQRRLGTSSTLFLADVSVKPRRARLAPQSAVFRSRLFYAFHWGRFVEVRSGFGETARDDSDSRAEHAIVASAPSPPAAVAKHFLPPAEAYAEALPPYLRCDGEANEVASQDSAAEGGDNHTRADAAVLLRKRRWQGTSLADVGAALLSVELWRQWGSDGSAGDEQQQQAASISDSASPFPFAVVASSKEAAAAAARSHALSASFYAFVLGLGPQHSSANAASDSISADSETRRSMPPPPPPLSAEGAPQTKPLQAAIPRDLLTFDEDAAGARSGQRVPTWPLREHSAFPATPQSIPLPPFTVSVPEAAAREFRGTRHVSEAFFSQYGALLSSGEDGGESPFSFPLGRHDEFIGNMAGNKARRRMRTGRPEEGEAEDGLCEWYRCGDHGEILRRLRRGGPHIHRLYNAENATGASSPTEPTTDSATANTSVAIDVRVVRRFLRAHRRCARPYMALALAGDAPTEVNAARRAEAFVGAAVNGLSSALAEHFAAKERGQRDATANQPSLSSRIAAIVLEAAGDFAAAVAGREAPSSSPPPQAAALASQLATHPQLLSTEFATQLRAFLAQRVGLSPSSSGGTSASASASFVPFNFDTSGYSRAVWLRAARMVMRDARSLRRDVEGLRRRYEERLGGEGKDTEGSDRSGDQSFATPLSVSSAARPSSSFSSSPPCVDDAAHVTKAYADPTPLLSLLFTRRYSSNIGGTTPLGVDSSSPAALAESLAFLHTNASNSANWQRYEPYAYLFLWRRRLAMCLAAPSLCPSSSSPPPSESAVGLRQLIWGPPSRTSSAANPIDPIDDYFTELFAALLERERMAEEGPSTTPPLGEEADGADLKDAANMDEEEGRDGASPLLDDGTELTATRTTHSSAEGRWYRRSHTRRSVHHHRRRRIVRLACYRSAYVFHVRSPLERPSADFQAEGSIGVWSPSNCNTTDYINAAYDAAWQHYGTCPLRLPTQAGRTPPEPDVGAGRSKAAAGGSEFAAIAAISDDSSSSSEGAAGPSPSSDHPTNDPLFNARRPLRNPRRDSRRLAHPLFTLPLREENALAAAFAASRREAEAAATDGLRALRRLMRMECDFAELLSSATASARGGRMSPNGNVSFFSSSSSSSYFSAKSDASDAEVDNNGRGEKGEEDMVRYPISGGHQFIRLRKAVRRRFDAYCRGLVAYAHAAAIAAAAAAAAESSSDAVPPAGGANSPPHSHPRPSSLSSAPPFTLSLPQKDTTALVGLSIFEDTFALLLSGGGVKNGRGHADGDAIVNMPLTGPNGAFDGRPASVALAMNDDPRSDANKSPQPAAAAAAMAPGGVDDANAARLQWAARRSNFRSSSASMGDYAWGSSAAAAATNGAFPKSIPSASSLHAALGITFSSASDEDERFPPHSAVASPQAADGSGPYATASAAPPSLSPFDICGSTDVGLDASDAKGGGINSEKGGMTKKDAAARLVVALHRRLYNAMGHALLSVATLTEGAVREAQRPYDALLVSYLVSPQGNNGADGTISSPANDEAADSASFSSSSPAPRHSNARQRPRAAAIRNSRLEAERRLLQRLDENDPIRRREEEEKDEETSASDGAPPSGEVARRATAKRSGAGLPTVFLTAGRPIRIHQAHRSVRRFVAHFRPIFSRLYSDVGAGESGEEADTDSLPSPERTRSRVGDVLAFDFSEGLADATRPHALEARNATIRSNGSSFLHPNAPVVSVGSPRFNLNSRPSRRALQFHSLSTADIIFGTHGADMHGLTYLKPSGLCVELGSSGLDFSRSNYEMNGGFFGQLAYARRIPYFKVHIHSPHQQRSGPDVLGSEKGLPRDATAVYASLPDFRQIYSFAVCGWLTANAARMGMGMEDEAGEGGLDAPRSRAQRNNSSSARYTHLVPWWCRGGSSAILRSLLRGAFAAETVHKSLILSRAPSLLRAVAIGARRRAKGSAVASAAGILNLDASITAAEEALSLAKADLCGDVEGIRPTSPSSEEEMPPTTRSSDQFPLSLSVVPATLSSHGLAAVRPSYFTLRGLRTPYGLVEPYCPPMAASVGGVAVVHNGGNRRRRIRRRGGSGDATSGNGEGQVSEVRITVRPPTVAALVAMQNECAVGATLGTHSQNVFSRRRPKNLFRTILEGPARPQEAMRLRIEGLQSLLEAALGPRVSARTAQWAARLIVGGLSGVSSVGLRAGSSVTAAGAGHDANKGAARRHYANASFSPLSSPSATPLSRLRHLTGRRPSLAPAHWYDGAEDGHEGAMAIYAEAQLIAPTLSALGMATTPAQQRRHFYQKLRALSEESYADDEMSSGDPNPSSSFFVCGTSPLVPFGAEGLEGVFPEGEVFSSNPLPHSASFSDRPLSPPEAARARITACLEAMLSALLTPRRQHECSGRTTCGYSDALGTEGSAWSSKSGPALPSFPRVEGEGALPTSGPIPSSVASASTTFSSMLPSTPLYGQRIGGSPKINAALLHCFSTFFNGGGGYTNIDVIAVERASARRRIVSWVSSQFVRVLLWPTRSTFSSPMLTDDYSFGNDCTKWAPPSDSIRR